MANQASSDYIRRMTRGVLLTNLYLAYHQGLNDPSAPRTMGRMVMEMSLQSRGMPPTPEMIRALGWMEGQGYVTVDWAMDDQTNYESVTLTQKGINLYESKRAASEEPGIALPPRRD